MTKKSSSRGGSLIFLLIFAAVIFYSSRFWLPWIGTSLLVPDRVRNADCIVALRGEESVRLGKAAELYRQGMAPVIVTSVVPAAAQSQDMVRRITGLDKIGEVGVALKIFDYFGVKSQAVLFTGKETTSTFDEAMAARDFLLQKKFHSFILVTSTYHMRRALMIFRLVFRETDIEIYNVTADNPLYHPSQWWTRERDVRRVFEEHVSFVFNWLYHFVLGKQKTSFDTV